MAAAGLSWGGVRTAGEGLGPVIADPVPFCPVLCGGCGASEVLWERDGEPGVLI